MAHAFGLEGGGKGVGRGVELGITETARLIHQRRTLRVLLRCPFQCPGQGEVLFAIADTGVVQAAQHARYTRQMLRQAGEKTQRGNQIGLAHGSRAYGCYAAAKANSSRPLVRLPWLWRKPGRADGQITARAVAEPLGLWHYRVR